MTNILITTGTTHFNSLCELGSKWGRQIQGRIIIQDKEFTGNHEVLPNVSSVRWIKNIEYYVNQVDLVVTHCGAGSVFKLLQQDIRFVVCPNYERSDDHQIELAGYLRNYQLAPVKSIVELNNYEIRDLIEISRRDRYNKYVRPRQFDMLEFMEILDFASIDNNSE